MTVEFYGESFPVARKSHRCDECGHEITKGERYSYWTGKTDGSVSTWKSHADCREAVLKLNKLHGSRDGDEWLSLSDLELDDREWLCEHFPAVAARVGWSIYDWQEPRLCNGAFFGSGSHYVWQVPR